MTDTILYTRHEYVARIVLNDPKRHNALGCEQLEGIRARLKQIADEGEARVLILTGAGDKTFCAGASLHELSDGRMGDDAFQKMTEQVASLAIPTICALNGNVFGGGVELAASCDFRIGISGCRMRVPAAELGICYPLSGILRFKECLGVGATKRLLVAAEEFDSDEMKRIGFLDQLVAPHALEETVQEFAQRVAGLAPLAVQSMKHLLRMAASGGADPNFARVLSTKCLDSIDAKEGFAAKREKRQPSFKGH